MTSSVSVTFPSRDTTSSINLTSSNITNDGKTNINYSSNYSNDGMDAIFLTSEEIASFLDEMRANRAAERNYDDVTQTVIVTTFAALMVFGALGNSLVCWAVARNPKMRTSRNVFIVNLAISDFTLCAFTQLFNVHKVVTNEWKFGLFMCKFAPMLTGTNVFVSTISITAISLDRFRVIVHPTRQSSSLRLGRLKTIGYLLIVWFIAFIIASPLAVFNVIQPFAPFPLFPALYEMCVENKDLITVRKVYSVLSLIVQYVLPIIIVSMAHARISRKLGYRLTLRQTAPALLQQVALHQRSRGELKRPVFKTNQLPSARGRRFEVFNKRCNFERFSNKMKKKTSKSESQVSSQIAGQGRQCIAERGSIAEQHDTPFTLDESIIEQHTSLEHNPVKGARESQPWTVDRSEKNQCNWHDNNSVKKVRKVNEDDKHHDIELTEPDRTENSTTSFYATKRRREERRRQRTNRLLVLIALVFAASWMPLNIANVINDFDFTIVQTFNDNFANLLFPVCHLLVLCSACINPVLYGWLNDNFRREFVCIFKSCLRRVASLMCCCGCRAGMVLRSRLQCRDGQDLQSGSMTAGDNGVSFTIDYICKTSVFEGGLMENNEGQN